MSERLCKPKLFLIIDLLPFAKLLELLAIDHSSSERRIIFVEVLSCSGCFITCMGAHVPAAELDNAIWFSILSGCQDSCGIVPNGHAGSVGSFNICQGLKC